MIFDDYNPTQFPGVFKAVNYIRDNLGYSLQKILNSTTNKGYVIATKLRNFFFYIVVDYLINLFSKYQ